jgi:DNA-binding HxlR family transcriptional regulator
MDPGDLSTENCPIGRTLDLIGAPWTLLVLREAFTGARRFSEFQRGLGVPRALLSQRLDQLVEHGIFERRAYQEPGQRGRTEYRLTRKGRDLYPVIAALRAWGERYTLDDDGPPLIIRHKHCGGTVHTRLTCEHGHHPGVTELTAEPGPGARPQPGRRGAPRTCRDVHPPAR